MADREFRIIMKSVGGMIVGNMPTCAALSGAHTANLPEYSDTDFVRWQPGYTGTHAGGEVQWESYYAPSLAKPAGDITPLAFVVDLRDRGAISIDTAIEVVEIQLVDQYNNPVPSPSLVMMAHTSSNNASPEFWLARKDTVEGVSTYTLLTDRVTVTMMNEQYAYSDEYGICAGVFTVGGVVSYGLGICVRQHDNRYDSSTCSGEIFLATEAAFINELTCAPGGEPYSEEFGPGSEPGGYGPGSGGSSGSGGPGPTFDGTSDPWVDYPTKPGIAALGLVNLYKCDVGSLVNLGAEIFPDIHFPTSLSDVGAVIAAVSDSIWNSKLIDYIVSAHIIPIDVPAGALADIKVGIRTMNGILARPISNDIIEFDCGSLHIDEFYTSFVDYGGLTRCRIYLPFYGWVDVKPEYWQSATLSIKYKFNVIDGSFIAQIFSTVTRHQVPFTAMIGQYTGCACVHVPMTGAEYSSMFSGMIANAGGMAAGFASGNVAGAASSALNMTENIGGGGNVTMSNAYNASAGFYGHPCPYLIIERPVSHFPTAYASESGVPLIQTRRIGSCRGLTICDNPVLNFGCSEEEGKAIIAALKEGVIV